MTSRFSCLTSIGPVLRYALVLLLFPAALFAGDPAPAGNAAGPAALTDCQALGLRVEEQQAAIARELRTVKRELAALRQELSEPGLSEAFSGVGYILGLFGVAAFMASRRSSSPQEP